MAINRLNRNEFEGLFDLYYKDLTGFVYGFVNDLEVARDLVHDIFLNLWKNRSVLNPDRSVKSYLFTIARNSALNYLKHQRVIAINEWQVADEYENTDGDEEELEERLKRVRKRLEELPEKQRAVVLRCYVEGKMYKEVAAEFNISENTVKTHLMRGMKFLREGLREDFVLLFLWSTTKKPDFCC